MGSAPKPEVLGRLTSQLGIPMMPDTLTKQRDRGQYARVLVHVEIKEQAKTKVFYRDEKGRLVHQQVNYEWLPVKCPKCKGYGHEATVCRKKLERKVWLPKIQPQNKTNADKDQGPRTTTNQGNGMNQGFIQPTKMTHARGMPKKDHTPPVIDSNQFTILDKLPEEEHIVESQIQELLETVHVEKSVGPGIEVSVVLPIQDPADLIPSRKGMITHTKGVSGTSPLSVSADNG